MPLRCQLHQHFQAGKRIGNYFLEGIAHQAAPYLLLQAGDRVGVLLGYRDTEHGGGNPVIADDAGYFLDKVNRLVDVASPVGGGDLELGGSVGWFDLKAQRGQCGGYLLRAELNAQEPFHLAGGQPYWLSVSFARVNINNAPGDFATAQLHYQPGGVFQGGNGQSGADAPLKAH